MNKLAMYTALQEEYLANVTSLFEENIFEMLVYDEVERFTSNTDPLFNYPFTKRKNIISKFTIANISDITSEDQLDTYHYNKEVVEF